MWNDLWSRNCLATLMTPPRIEIKALKIKLVLFFWKAAMVEILRTKATKRCFQISLWKMMNYCHVVDCANQSDWFKGKEPSCTNLNHQSAIIFQIMEPFLALWRAFPAFPHCWIHLNSPESTFIHINQLFFFSSNTSNMAAHSKCSEKNHE